MLLNFVKKHWVWEKNKYSEKYGRMHEESSYTTVTVIALIHTWMQLFTRYSPMLQSFTSDDMLHTLVLSYGFCSPGSKQKPLIKARSSRLKLTIQITILEARNDSRLWWSSLALVTAILVRALWIFKILYQLNIGNHESGADDDKLSV